MQQFLRTSGLATRRKDAAVYAAWDEALGAELAAAARAVSFRAGQLAVEVSTSALLQELKGFTGEGYRERANQLMDTPRIRRVTFRLRRRP